jgi:ABC-2 type transport system permease protein
VIRRVFAHEMRCASRDGRTRWAAGLTLLLLLAALASGWSYRRTLAAERALAAAEERSRWLGQGRKNAHSAAHYGTYVFRPASALSAIDRGIEPFVGVGTWLEAHHMNQFVHRPAQDGTAITRFGELTAALVGQVLLPLLVVLVGFSAFASERESGTLRQLLSLGVSRRTLLAGKLLALAAILGVLVGPGALVGAIAIGRQASEALPDQGLRVTALATVYLAYLAGWVLLTIGVSARASSGRVALVALLGVWAFGCLALPRLAGDMAGGLHPAPSTAAFRQALEGEVGPAHSSDRALAVRDRVMREYGVTRPEDLPIDWRGISLQEEEERNHPIFDRHFGALFDVYRAQDVVLQSAGLIAPLLAVQSLSHALAGTDFEHHRRFVVAAEAQRRVVQKLMNAEVTLHDREDRPNHLSGVELWSRVPEFRYSGPTLTEIVPRYLRALFALAVWVLGTAWIARSGVRRLEA